MGAWNGVHSVRAAVISVVFGAALAGLGGCVGWASYPPEAGQNPRLSDPNELHMTDVMVVGFNEVIRKFPPGTEPGKPMPAKSLAVNLPPDLKPLIHRRTVGRIQGAVPLTPATEKLPTYHLVSMRVRGDEAQVNILRPVAEVEPSPSGENVYQEIRVSLRGGVKYWKVVGMREWTPVPASPELHYFDEAAAARAEATLGGGG